MTLAAVALATSRIRLGTNVTNPQTRDWTVSASAAVSRDELSGGRALLGLGAGDRAVRPLGGQPARLARVREAVQMIRSLSAGEWVTRGERRIRLKAAEGRRRAVPIYLGASRPKMLQLAGELADGVILLAGVAPENLRYALANVQLGAERAGRRLADLEVVLGLYCYVGDDWQEARRLARPFAAKFALRRPEALRAAGIPVPEPGPVSEPYPDLVHAEDWGQAIALSDWVPDDVLELFCETHTVMGDASEVIRRLERIISSGVTNFYLVGFSPYRPPRDVARAFARQVIPYFQSVGSRQ